LVLVVQVEELVRQVQAIIQVVMVTPQVPHQVRVMTVVMKYNLHHHIIPLVEVAHQQLVGIQQLLLWVLVVLVLLIPLQVHL
tara:strand:- start:184 stop:429 length:246 start_codon:yes stop_codon:yes gene_type:complete